MATISSLGSGSGLDLNGLLTSLMQAEQRPLTALQTREASYQARISAYGSLNGALSSLQTAASSMVPGTGVSLSEKYQTAGASVGDSSIATASATTSAVAGSYAFEVSALAKAQRLVSPVSSDIPAIAAINASLTAGGSLKIQIGSLSAAPAYAYTPDASKELNVTVAAGGTLENLRDAINTAATDGRVLATIINGTSGKQLILTSGNSGTSNVLKLTGNATLGTGFDFDPSGSASGSGNLSQTASGGQAASNAAFTLNGIAATSSTNTVTGVLDGVTLTLTKETTTATTLTITKSQTSALNSALTAFIKSYNDTNTTINSLGAYNTETKKGSVLTGNSTLRNAQYQIRDLIFNTTQGGTSAYQKLSDIGVSMGKDGTLSLNNTKLTAAINADFSGVAKLVSTVGTAFDDSMDGLISTTGNVTTAISATKRQITDITKQQQKVSDRLVAIEARYRAQFTSLDTLIAGMKQTSSYLSSQLANLPKIG